MLESSYIQHKKLIHNTKKKIKKLIIYNFLIIFVNSCNGFLLCFNFEINLLDKDKNLKISVIIEDITVE